MASQTWKVMVYFAGQNRLADDMVYSLKDMKSVGSDNNLTLLAQYSAKWLWKKYSNTVELPTPLRFHLKANEKWVVSDHVNPGHYERPEYCFVKELSDFIWWGIKYEYKKSDRYMIILSGDGGGPVSTFLPSIMEPHKKLHPFELHRVFQRISPKVRGLIGRKIDVVGLDSCLMSTAEIGYELRTYVDYLVSSQGNVDDIGWPYRDILSWLKQNPTTSPENLTKQTVDVYNSYFVDYAMIGKSSGNLSALTLSAFDDLAPAIESFVDAAMALLRNGSRSKNAQLSRRLFAQLLVRAHWVAQTYRDDQYADLYDFCDKLVEEIGLVQAASSARNVDFSRVIEACNVIKQILCGASTPGASYSQKVVVKSCHVGAKYQYSRGLSIYFPWNRIREAYGAYTKGRKPTGRQTEHSLPRATGWRRFLERYLAATERSPREGFKLGPEWNRLMRDPPEGKGERTECETAKNPTLTWEIANCIDSPKNL
ncbi:MAG: clostripain-related cysteine peptidase [Acidobacteriota bacterium]